jgi:chemotaxis protein histidine kinase CheA
MIHELFECLYQFLNRFPDSLDFVQFCEAPLNITLRQSTSDFTFSIDGSHDFEHWQIFVRIVREQMKDIRSQANFIVKDQSSFGLLLRFPFESVTSQNLLVESAGERLALSVRTLMETGRVDVQRVQKIGSKRFVPFRDGVIPLVSLGQILKFDQNKKTNTLVADIENQNSQLCPQWLEFVIAKNSNNLIAFEVDSVLGQREMVVREVSKIVPKFSGLLGVSVLEDERVSMVLDVTQLITSDELSRGDYARKVS